MMISWLLHSVSNDIGESIIYCETASEIWDELEERFEKANGARIFQVQRDLCQISQGNLSVSAYFTKIKRLRDEYAALIKIPPCTCGSTKDLTSLLQNQKLMQFLMGLNDSYRNIRGNILMISPLPSVSQAYQLILQEEKQRDVYNVPFIQPESAAMHSNNERVQRTQGKENSTGQAMEKRSQLFCRYCKKQGHGIEKCNKLHGNPSGNSKAKRMAANMHYGSEDGSTTIDDKDSHNAVEGQESGIGSGRGAGGLNKDQISQLMSLFGKLNAQDATSGVNQKGHMGVLCLQVPSMRRQDVLGKHMEGLYHVTRMIPQEISNIESKSRLTFAGLSSISDLEI